MKRLAFIFCLFFCGCAFTTGSHRTPSGDVYSVLHTSFLQDEKAGPMFLRTPDGSVFVLGNYQSNPDATAVQAISSAAMMIGVKSLAGMVMPLAAPLLGVP